MFDVPTLEGKIEEKENAVIIIFIAVSTLIMPAYFLVSNGIQEIRENGFGRENVPAMMAAVVVISIPLIVLFLIFRNKIMEGVSRGGIKG